MKAVTFVPSSPLILLAFGLPARYPNNIRKSVQRARHRAGSFFSAQWMSRDSARNRETIPVRTRKEIACPKTRIPPRCAKPRHPRQRFRRNSRGLATGPSLRATGYRLRAVSGCCRVCQHKQDTYNQILPKPTRQKNAISRRTNLRPRPGPNLKPVTCALSPVFQATHLATISVMSSSCSPGL